MASRRAEASRACSADRRAADASVEYLETTRGLPAHRYKELEPWRLGAPLQRQRPIQDEEAKLSRCGGVAAGRASQ